MGKLFAWGWNLYLQHREVYDYLFWGVMTTVVNYVAYFVCTLGLGINYLVSNGIAWVIAVAFGFVVNKAFVFRSRDWSAGTVFRQGSQFVGARVFSGVVETAILMVFVEALHFPDSIVKIVAGVVVVVLNYIFSKFIIFKKKARQPTDTSC